MHLCTLVIHPITLGQCGSDFIVQFFHWREMWAMEEDLGEKKLLHPSSPLALLNWSLPRSGFNFCFCLCVAALSHHIQQKWVSQLQIIIVPHFYPRCTSLYFCSCDVLQPLCYVLSVWAAVREGVSLSEGTAGLVAGAPPGLHHDLNPTSQGLLITLSVVGKCLLCVKWQNSEWLEREGTLCLIMCWVSVVGPCQDIGPWAL